MLVPLSGAQVPSRGGTDERMSTPGAETSGLIGSEIGRRAAAREATAICSCLLTAAAVIALAALPGDETVPSPKLVVVVPGGDHGHDAGVGCGVDRGDDEVAARLDLGLAEREVDHVHAVADGGLDPGGDLRSVAVEPEAAVGTVSTL